MDSGAGVGRQTAAAHPLRLVTFSVTTVHAGAVGLRLALPAVRNATSVRFGAEAAAIRVHEKRSLPVYVYLSSGAVGSNASADWRLAWSGAAAANSSSQSLHNLTNVSVSSVAHAHNAVRYLSSLSEGLATATEAWLQVGRHCVTSENISFIREESTAMNRTVVTEVSTGSYVTTIYALNNVTNVTSRRYVVTKRNVSSIQTYSVAANRTFYRTENRTVPCVGAAADADGALVRRGAVRLASLTLLQRAVAAPAAAVNTWQCLCPYGVSGERCELDAFEVSFLFADLR